MCLVQGIVSLADIIVLKLNTPGRRLHPSHTSAHIAGATFHDQTSQFFGISVYTDG